MNNAQLTWLRTPESSRKRLAEKPRKEKEFEGVLKEFAKRIMAGGRVEDGKAPLSWGLDPTDRLKDYLRNGLPYMARVDVCDDIREFATLVLGFPHTMRTGSFSPSWAYDKTIWVGGEKLEGTGSVEDIYTRRLEYILEFMQTADDARYKGKYTEEKYGPGHLEDKYLGLPGLLWWQAAKARAKAGLPYVVLHGSPLTKFCGYPEPRRRMDYYVKNHKRISEDLVLDYNVGTQFTKRKWVMAEPAWASPGMPGGYAKVAVRLFPSTLGISEVPTKSPYDHVLDAYWSAGGPGLPRIELAHKDCGSYNLSRLAYKKFGFSPEDRDSKDSWVAGRAVLKHGFTPEQLAQPFLSLSRRLQRVYVRLIGVPNSIPLDALDGSIGPAVRRCLRRGASTSYDDSVDLFLSGKEDVVFARIIGNGYPAASAMTLFFAAAWEIMAAHPDEVCEYLTETCEKDKHSTKILGAIVRDSQNILLSKEHRNKALAEAEFREMPKCQQPIRQS